MKRLAVIFLLFISFQCSKNETEKPFTMDQLQYAPRVNIPMESLPEWVVSKINDLEYLRKNPNLYTFAQIAKGVWNEKIVYIVIQYTHTYHYSDFEHYVREDFHILFISNEKGNVIFYTSEELSTSKNWVVIYEYGDVLYSDLRTPKDPKCSESKGDFSICKLQYAPRVNMPIEYLPEWLVAMIDDFEKYCSPSSNYKQLVKCEWNEEVVYLIRQVGSSFIDDVYNEAGDIIYHLILPFSVGDFSTSKNWVVIYECGEVHYPTMTTYE